MISKLEVCTLPPPHDPSPSHNTVRITRFSVKDRGLSQRGSVIAREGAGMYRLLQSGTSATVGLLLTQTGLSFEEQG